MDDDMIAFSSSVSGSAVFPAEMGGEHVGAVLYTNFAGESDEELEAVMEKVAELSEELMAPGRAGRRRPDAQAKRGRGA